jgi:hypothetical protein
MSVGQQPERLDVSRPESGEMAAVERRELRLIEPLGDRQHGGVDEADVGVGVPIAELRDAAMIGPRANDVGSEAPRPFVNGIPLGAANGGDAGR